MNRILVLQLYNKHQRNNRKKYHPKWEKWAKKPKKALVLVNKHIKNSKFENNQGNAMKTIMRYHFVSTEFKKVQKRRALT